MNDPIGDFIIRLKNASLANRFEVVAPHSNFREEMAKILREEKLIDSYEVKSDEGKKQLIVKLLVVGNKTRLIEAKKVSKLGKRVYAQAKDLYRLNRGLGILIVSTPKGLMTAQKAKKENQGGEVICRITI